MKVPCKLAIPDAPCILELENGQCSCKHTEMFKNCTQDKCLDSKRKAKARDVREPLTHQIIDWQHMLCLDASQQPVRVHNCLLLLHGLTILWLPLMLQHYVGGKGKWSVWW